MSWQAYVDTSLVASGNVDKAAIFSIAGDSQWATSKDFEIKPEELKEIVSAYKDPNKPYSDGVHVAGKRYVVHKADERSIYGKQGKEGILIVKTVQAILICHYPDGIIPGNAASTVEKLADYLIGVGY